MRKRQTLLMFAPKNLMLLRFTFSERDQFFAIGFKLSERLGKLCLHFIYFSLRSNNGCFRCIPILMHRRRSREMISPRVKDPLSFSYARRTRPQLEQFKSQLAFRCVGSGRKHIDDLRNKIRELIFVKTSRIKLCDNLHPACAFFNCDRNATEQEYGRTQTGKLSLQPVLFSSPRRQPELSRHVLSRDKKTETSNGATKSTTNQSLPSGDGIQANGHQADQYDQQDAKQQEREGKKVIPLIHATKLPSIATFVERIAA